MSNGPERKNLRRGLSALMADVGVATSDIVERDRLGARSMPIERVHPNPDQPRRTFMEEDLSDLAASIAQRGIIQPLIVRPLPGRLGEMQIVAGERRWRAAQRAGLHEIPVIVRDFDDTEVLEVAIIENIQRADLNSVEEAQGFKQLMERFGHTQEQLSVVLGKSRSHVANLMRLLKLPDAILDHLREGRLSAGHARALINADDPIDLARQVISRGLSVRETERLARRKSVPVAPGGSSLSDKRPVSGGKNADTLALESDVSAALGLTVSIDHDDRGGGGRVSISYGSLEDLDRLCGILSRGHEIGDIREDAVQQDNP